MTDEELYRRGIDTAVACWRRFAASVPDAAVHRLEHADVAVFPRDPERSIYNNAVLARGASSHQLDAVEQLYAEADVPGYAVWVHESDGVARDVIERRGYRIVTSTRAMGMQRGDFRDAPAAVDLTPADWREHKRIVGVDAALLGSLELRGFGLVVAAEGGERVATGLSFDHTGDCGIYNVTTMERARRRGIGAAVTAKLVRDAWERGCVTATLQSTPVAERMYASLGFRDLGRIVEYEPARLRTHDFG
jgi:ribosomal protein S18 acetylase RimI-like enzyme